MIKRYLNFEKKSIIKKVISNLKIASILTIASFSFVTAKEVVKEVYEEKTNENLLIDLDYNFLGTVIIKNKDNRSQEQLYKDIENKIFQVENIELAFSNPENLTMQQKKALVDDIIKTIAKEANISTDKFKIVNTNYAGYYMGEYNSLFSYSQGNIYLNSKALKNSSSYDINAILEDTSISFQRNIETIIHEMLHAVKNENLMRRSNISKFEKEVFAKEYANDYRTSFIEIDAQLVASSIYDNLSKTYSNNYNKYETSIQYNLLPTMMREIYLNLYDVITSAKNSVPVSDLPDDVAQRVKEDPLNLSNLTIEELILKGYKKKLDVAKISYKNINLKETDYYKTFINNVPEDVLNVRYVDLMNKTFDKFNDVERVISNFESSKSQFPGSLIILDMAKFLNNLRYYSSEFSQAENEQLIDVFNAYVEKISEKDLTKYGLNDYEQVINSVKENIYVEENTLN